MIVDAAHGFRRATLFAAAWLTIVWTIAFGGLAGAEIYRPVFELDPVPDEYIVGDRLEVEELDFSISQPEGKWHWMQNSEEGRTLFVAEKEISGELVYLWVQEWDEGAGGEDELANLLRKQHEAWGLEMVSLRRNIGLSGRERLLYDFVDGDGVEGWLEGRLDHAEYSYLIYRYADSEGPSPVFDAFANSFEIPSRIRAEEVRLENEVLRSQKATPLWVLLALVLAVWGAAGAVNLLQGREVLSGAWIAFVGLAFIVVIDTMRAMGGLFSEGNWRWLASVLVNGLPVLALAAYRVWRRHRVSRG